MIRLDRLVVRLAQAAPLIAAGILLNSGMADTPEAKQPAKDSARQPPAQDAVLAKNTVVRANVPYGNDDKQRLDIYSPKGLTGGPVVVFVHGGEWTRGNKAAVSYKPKFF